MSASPAPPLPGGSGTFSVATWNIRSARRPGLVAAAKGLRQMGVGCTVLTKTKLTEDQYPKHVEGYHVIVLKATSPQQGGIALPWTAEHQDFEVGAVKIVSPNVLMFQLIMGGVRFFVIGAYIPLADTTGLDNLRAAWANHPTTCKPLLLGDLNINFGSLQNSQEETIADLLNKINLINMSQKYVQQRGKQQGKGARWTWWQQRGVHWHQSQPDYCMAWGEDVKLFCNVAFWQPRFHTSDHRAIVASIVRGRHGRLKLYRQRCQRFPLQLPPVEEQDQQLRLFEELQKTCKENATMKCLKNGWISEESWRLLLTEQCSVTLAACVKQGGVV
jgi:hypothetical protein